jgi:hypothetical protein
MKTYTFPSKVTEHLQRPLGVHKLKAIEQLDAYPHLRSRLVRDRRTQAEAERSGCCQT